MCMPCHAQAHREHTYHRVIAAERLRRSLAARQAEAATAAAAKGAAAKGRAAAAPSEASAFAELLRSKGRTGGGAAGAALLALRLLPSLDGAAAALSELAPEQAAEAEAEAARAVAARSRAGRGVEVDEAGFPLPPLPTHSSRADGRGQLQGHLQQVDSAALVVTHFTSLAS